MPLHENGRQVQSKEDLIRFLVELRKDLSEQPEGWENRTLDGHFEAMEAWLTDSEAVPSDPTWQTIADLLLAARIYE
ncbi:DUF7660 family protein [Paenibacillus sp. S-38]|uniref:DUF7660 family protein n=1 Tax=Paenibacillus sp. S-38 TaxID=3416710 RepID=UPI003CF39283